MDNNELRDAIEGTLEHTCYEDFETQATSILSILAPILADAERWRKVKEIAENNCFPCPLKESPCLNCNPKIIQKVVDALEGGKNGQ